MNCPSRATLVAALMTAAATSGCGPATPAPAATTTPPSVASTTSTPPPKPLDCDALCTKANTVAGCATEPANVPACVELCKAMLDGACKAQVEAELACAAKITLACKPDGTVEWGACVAEQKAANECARTSMAAPPP